MGAVRDEEEKPDRLLLDKLLAEHIQLREDFIKYLKYQTEKENKQRTDIDTKLNDLKLSTGLHNEGMSHQASSSAWGSAIALSGILLTAFTILIGKDKNCFILPWLTIDFVSLNVFTCGLLILNFKKIKSLFVNENTKIMRPVKQPQTSQNNTKAIENGKDGSDNNKKKNKPTDDDWITGKENLAYSALIIQFIIILIVCITIR